MAGSTASGRTRRHLLTGGTALLVGLAPLRTAGAQAPAVRGPQYAVFTEYSPGSKLLKGGWNTRIFTDTDSRKGNAIQCDFATGIVTVTPGIYHLSGLSVVTYNSGGEPAEMTTIRAPASAGYCRLRTLGANPIIDPGMRDVSNDDPSVICIGSPTTANLAPSLFEAYFEADRPTQMVLEHQSGSNPEQIYLRVFIQNSKWHAMARVAIRKV